MNTQNKKQLWEAYCDTEIKALQPILQKYSIELDTHQPHIIGERYLMQAITTTSGKKLILLGKNADGKKVVIKATRDSFGKKEIEREHLCRNILHKINFAGEVFHTPNEFLYIHTKNFLMSVTQFIDQESTFLERPINEQFFFALKAFKAQEATHATTWSHLKLITGVFDIRSSNNYTHAFAMFKANIAMALPHNHQLHSILNRAYTTLTQHKEAIEQYCGFLTHTDFVPHNIRIHNENIYLLDHSSLTFGNKYEGWARFLNFMTLYNPELEQAFTTYVAQNKTPEESVSLHVMRIYRLGEIIWYYVQTLDKCEGNLKLLNNARVNFWSTVLKHILNNEKIPESVRTTYIQICNSLRSEDEKKRQHGLH